MIKIIKKGYPLFFSISVGIILAVLVFLIIRPFINPLLGGIILAYLSYSLYNALNKKIKQETISALITTTVMILILVIPMFYAANSIAHEANKLYTYSKTSFSFPDYESCKGKANLFCKINNQIVKYSKNDNFRKYLKGFFYDIYKGFSQNGKTVISMFTHLLINFFVLIITTYFLLKDGKKFLEYSLKRVPFNKKIKDKFISKFRDLTDAVVYGQIIVALVQGVLAAVCFWVFGIQSPLIWGFITFIVSLLPLVGPYLVYIPLGLFKLSEGFATQNPHAALNGVLILLFGFAIISTVDNFLRYKITGTKARQHPLIVLIGVLGGFNLFGFVGLFFGPLILVFALVFMEVITGKNEIQDKKA